MNLYRKLTVESGDIDIEAFLRMLQRVATETVGEPYLCCVSRDSGSDTITNIFTGSNNGVYFIGLSKSLVDDAYEIVEETNIKNLSGGYAR